MPEIRCPKCGSKTSLRTRREDGQKFYVCIRYPQCKGKVEYNEEWDDWEEETPITPRITKVAASSPKNKTVQLKNIIAGLVFSIIVIVAAVYFLGDSCTSPHIPLITTHTYTIQVTGTSGVEFTGSYMVVETGGSSTSQSVDGTVPQSYSVTGTMVSVFFQNLGDSGTLTVQILEGSTVIKQASTTAAYGVVGVTTD